MVWTPAQAGAFLDYAETHNIVLYPLFLLILHRGLRRGEAVGLRDADVELDTGSITVSQQITTIGRTPVTKKVKSEAGERTVSLDATTLAGLRGNRARRARWQLVNGPPGPTPACSSSSPTAPPTTPKPSAPASNNSSPTPTCHPSGSTTCATAPPPSSKPPAPT
jgi:integrase